MRDLVAGNLGLLAAFGAGIVAFVSPCILPIIPSFLSFLGGVGGAGSAAGRGTRSSALVKVLFFVLGFSIIFVALGTIFSGFGVLLGGARILIYRIAGAIIVLFGLNLIFDFWKALNIERRFHLRGRPIGVLGSLTLGLAFGAGWTPCIGPVLASILFLAGTSETVGHGTLLLVAFSLGLGLPFILAGAFFDRFVRQAQRLRPHLHAIKIASGAILVGIGILVFAGSLVRMNALFFEWSSAFQTWRLAHPMAPRLLFGLSFLALSGGMAAIMTRRVRGLPAAMGQPVRGLNFPVLMGVVLVLALLSLLSFVDVLRPDELIGSWLQFQGV